MSSTMECSEARISLGVYVLGAIEPAERAIVDAHLATCQECRDELAGFAGLPALLARVSREEAIALADDSESPFPFAEIMPPEPPRELLATVLDLTQGRRRRRRWRDAGLAVAAAAVVAVGLFGGLRLGSSPAQPSVAAGTQSNLPVGPQNGAMATATGQSGGMTATVSYSSMGWGTYLDTKVKGIPVGTNCQLWVIDAKGDRVLASSWVTDDLEGTIWYPGGVGMSNTDITGFEVTVGRGRAIPITA